MALQPFAAVGAGVTNEPSANIATGHSDLCPCMLVTSLFGAVSFVTDRLISAFLR